MREHQPGKTRMRACAHAGAHASRSYVQRTALLHCTIAPACNHQDWASNTVWARLGERVCASTTRRVGLGVLGSGRAGLRRRLGAGSPQPQSTLLSDFLGDTLRRYSSPPPSTTQTQPTRTMTPTSSAFGDDAERRRLAARAAVRDALLVRSGSPAAHPHKRPLSAGRQRSASAGRDRPRSTGAPLSDDGMPRIDAPRSARGASSSGAGGGAQARAAARPHSVVQPQRPTSASLAFPSRPFTPSASAAAAPLEVSVARLSSATTLSPVVGRSAGVAGRACGGSLGSAVHVSPVRAKSPSGKSGAEPTVTRWVPPTRYPVAEQQRSAAGTREHAAAAHAGLARCSPSAGLKSVRAIVGDGIRTAGRW